MRFSTTILPHSEVVLPRYVDLRKKCPPVYDQGELGSCTANAGCACRIMLMNESQIDLSRLYLYYVERGIIPKKDEKVLGSHAVLVVGYKDIISSYRHKAKSRVNSGHLIIRNSWGSN